MRMTRVAIVAASLICAAYPSIPATAQSAIAVQLSNSQSAGRLSASSRIAGPIDEEQRFRLIGNTPPSARPIFDLGMVDAQLPMERMQLLLKRSPAQEAALEKFMKEQYDSASPNFHHWLKPDEFGALYGPSQAEIEVVQQWLQGHGFVVNQVSRGRTFIDFSGSAAQVQEAFHVEMHSYLVEGERHIGNDRDPSIPQALAPVVGGVASLHDFFPKPQSVLGKYVKRNRKTGKITPVDPEPQFEGKLRDMYTYTDSGSNVHEDITPWDFATIYNLIPLWNAGIDGTGQTIAIPALSDIEQTDINTFRSTFDLPAKTIQVVHNGTDPGVVAGDTIENTLDVEWSGAAAKNANVILVVSKTTSTTYGGELSQQYIVDNVDSLNSYITSASYGGCEILQGTSGNQSLNTIFQQGAAEGISMFVSAGDQGSTGCDNSDAHPTDQSNVAPANYGLNANAWATVPYVTGVGGTDFAWQFASSLSTYWNSSNNTGNQSTAIGYIPELPWNSTCTSSYLAAANQTTAEDLCNFVYNDFDSSTGTYPYIGLLKVTGGSGGVSSCTTSDGSSFSSCSGGYAKPSWQTGTGVPADGKRDVPDVSLFASGGIPDGLDGSAYLMCVAANASPYGCNYTKDVESGDIIYEEVGGTSVSSPAMAGIMALVLQKENGAPQGLANPVFYSLAAKSTCSSNTDTNSSTCIFHDVTTGSTQATLPGTNEQVCEINQPVGSGKNSRNCTAANTTDMFGVTTGYNATAGYDLTTGLGSVNAANLVNNWPSSSTGTTSATLTPGTETFPSTTVGVTSSTSPTVTLKNTGTTTLTINSLTLSGSGQNSFGASTTCGGTLAASASCTFTFTFAPQSAGTLTATFSVADTAGTQSVTLSGTGASATAPAISFTPTSVAFASTTVGSTSAATIITVKNTGTAAATLSSETLTGSSPSSFVISANNCPASLAAGSSCAVYVEFKPATATALAATLSVADNAAGSPQTVALSGTGTAATGGSTLTFTPASLGFASTAVGSETAAQEIVMKNTGTTAISFTSYKYTGANASSFVQTSSNCSTSLAAGSSCAFFVAFKPQSSGALSAALTATDNLANSPQSVPLSGTGTGGSALTVSVSPSSIAFGSLAVGSTSAAQSVTVTNTGTAAVTLSSETLTGSNPSSFVISANNCTATLAASASCTVSVEFKPASAAAFAATLSIADNATGTPQTVALSGTGVAGSSSTLTFTPASLSFASTAVGSETAAQEIIMKNTGTTAISFTSYKYTGANASSFVQTSSNCSTSLAAGSSCAFFVAFKPQSSGALSADLTATDNLAGSPQSVPLSGTGTGGSAATVTLSPTSLAFPNTIVGSTSDAQIVTLTNTGSASTTITGITLAGASPSSYEELNNCGATLAASASCSIYVAFKPASAAALAATLSVADSATGSPQTVALSGTGTAAPSVKLSATSLAFGTIAHGTTSEAQAVTLTNSGTATLTLASITLGGTGAADFEAIDTCAATLAPSASCTVYIAFKPAAAAAYSATLSIADNGSASPQAVTLTGTGN